jgi:uncharacterized membrane protein
MDISATWKKLEKEKLETPIEGDFHKDRSNHPVSKLKKNYFIKSLMMIVFVVLFAISFFYFDEIFIRSFFGLLTVAYVIFMATSYSMYKTINFDGPVLDVLIKTKDQVTRALKFEMISSLMIIPVGGVAGYLGGYSMSGKSINNIFSNPTQIGILVGTLVAFTVLGYYLGRKLTHEGYGKSLKEIDRLIDQLNH